MNVSSLLLDLHSTIVSAFQCLTQGWLTAHPYLLDDKETLNIIFEVVEYGISGGRSQVCLNCLFILFSYFRFFKFMRHPEEAMETLVIFFRDMISRLLHMFEPYEWVI